jgi:hypothetical protein
MFREPVSAIVTLAALIAVTGCDASKSANPLSATVAGPIPGVNITAPTPMQPSSGLRVAVDQQPVKLVVQNAATSGVRPLSYSFEVATDADFTNKVFSRNGISPGDGKTGLSLSDPLPTGHTYYWRSQALDGANTGPYSAVTTFNIFTPIVIQAPVPLAPINNVRTGDPHPRFSWTNAARSGPAGTIAYVVEVSTTDSFATKAAVWTVAEQSNQSGFDAPQDFGFSTQYFWHVRANDPTTTGPWSATQVFQTPAAPVVIPPVVTPPGCGGSASDGINMSLAAIYASPTDLAGWCVTARITSIQFTPGAILVDFDRRTGAGRWPDSPFGDGKGGTIQYTLGMCNNINGVWDCSAVVQFWNGRDLAASGAPAGIARNWFYDGRWGPLAGHQPAEGETVGLFVCAGNCRGTNGEASIVHERSNVRLVPWTNIGGTSY